MDSLEDISARLILKNVLQTERAKSPVKGRAMSSRTQSARTRRMSRMKTGRSKSGAGSPLVALQHKLKQRLREVVSSPPRHASAQNEESSRKPTLPLLEDQGATPRGLLRSIIQTQAEASMVSNQDMKPMTLHTSSTEEVRPRFTDSNLYNDNTRDPEVQPELDLSNVTLELKQPITKGLSRKRAPALISVSAFERQLECLTEKATEPDALENFSSNSSLGLTLNSPSLHMTSKRGQLLRKPTSRELVTEEVFDKAVHIRSQKCPESPGLPAGEIEGVSSWQEFTLGLSDVTVPDFIISNTAVYTQSISQPATIDHTEELEIKASERKQFQHINSQTTIKEVGSTYAEEMVPQTQEEGQSVSETAHLDDLDPMSKYNVQDCKLEPEKQQLDMPTLLAGTESLRPLVDELQAKTMCHDVTTLALATESEELTENGSGVAQMTRSLLQDVVTENLQSPEHAVSKGAFSSQHGATSEVSNQTGENHSMLKVGTEKDNGGFECEHGSQLDLPDVPFQRNIEEVQENVCQELAQQTPAFVRQRKEEPTIIRFSPVVQSRSPRPVAGKTRPHHERRNAIDRIQSMILPKTFVMTMFRHFAKTKVSSDVYPVVNEILQRYFGRMTEDLEVFASHAKRKTIEKEDVELLMRRQGFITDCTQVNVLIEKFLPLEYRKLLVPVATSGNKVIPKER